MRRRALVRFVLGLLFGIGFAAAFSVVAKAEAPAPAPRFREIPCDIDIPEEVRSRVRCGRIAVPRDYDNPGAGSFDLAVAHVRAERSSGAPPLIFLCGGPGEGCYRYTRTIIGYLPDRDLIVYDQRGAGSSQPRLCADGGQAQIAAFAAPLTFRETLARFRDSYLRCRREMARAGLRPDWFGTAVSTRDIERIAAAFGASRLDVHGVSYGTALGMDLLAARPDLVRYMLLDGVYGPDRFDYSTAASGQRALERVFAACQAAPGCRRRYPDLRERYRQTIDDLDRGNLVVPAPGLGLAGDRLYLSGRELQAMIFDMMYRRESIALIPEMIVAASERRPQPVRAGFGALVGQIDDIGNIFDYAAVECRDRARYRGQGLRETGFGSDLVELFGVCDGWSPAGPAPRLPAGAASPIVLVSGEFDPITPVAQADAVAAALGSSARGVLFDGYGHASVRRRHACAMTTARRFFVTGRPAPAPCVAAPDPVPFVTDLVPTPALTDLLIDTGQGRLVRPAALALPLLVAILLGAVWPALRAIRPRGRAGFASGPRLPALLTALGALAFVAGLSIAISGMAEANMATLGFGLSARYAWVLYLPWLIAAAALWGLWRLWRRFEWIAAAALASGLAAAGLCLAWGISAPALV
jgi:pimeloyl-ACP methyl ester carboxylesterase